MINKPLGFNGRNWFLPFSFWIIVTFVEIKLFLFKHLFPLTVDGLGIMALGFRI